MEQWYDYAGDPVTEKRWDTWSSYSELPQPGESQPFDNFLKEKGLDREALSRIGARWSVSDAGRSSIAYLFPDGIKYRALNGDRWAEEGVTWRTAKKVQASPETKGQAAIVVEGETDGASFVAKLRALANGATPNFSSGALRPESTGADEAPGIQDVLSDGSPQNGLPRVDVFILPAGAKNVPSGLEAQLSGYETVYLALDNDEAGNAGAAAIAELVPNARRLPPPVGFKDWCDAFSSNPDLLEHGGLAAYEVRPPRRVFSVREVIAADLGTYAENNWFDGSICPIGGETIIHGPIKSLKSVVVAELAKAITTGTTFAGYLNFCRPEGPGKVLLIQFEIPPRGFQTRLSGMLHTVPVAQRDLFLDNFMIYGVADRTRPRLKMQDKGFVAEIRNAVEEAEAEVIMFDPMQRMTGGANADKAHEMEPILDVFSSLQSAGLTVVYTHHDTKSGGNDIAAYNMSGSQRFGADADSICSLIYDPKVMIPDDNPGGLKQRNFIWELRSGATQGRSITASPDIRDPEFMHVDFDVPIVAAPVVTSSTTPTTTGTSAASVALGMPGIK